MTSQGMDLEREYPALTDLTMSGFHLDFWDFHESPEEVVSTFTGDPIFCARIPLEVESLLGEFAGPDREERLDKVLWKLTNNYVYAEDGITGSEWLTSVRPVERCSRSTRTPARSATAAALWSTRWAVAECALGVRGRMLSRRPSARPSSSPTTTGSGCGLPRARSGWSATQRVAGPTGRSPGSPREVSRT